MPDTVNVQKAPRVKRGETHFKLVMKSLLSNPKAIFGLAVLGIFVVIAIIAPYIVPFKPEAMSMDILVKPGTNGHLFGTDHLGRDLFSRVLVGTRYSVGLGIGATLISLFFGLILGAMAGYWGGAFDEALMRVIDVIQSIPGVLLNMALVTAFGSGYWKLMLALGVAGISTMARLERSAILSIRRMEYIDAASATNVPTPRKISRHIIPNAFAPVLVMATLTTGTTIMSAAGLSFLGCGMPASMPEWGALLSAGRDYIKEAAYLCICPGIFLIFYVLAVNLFGDGLRDALDPKLKK